MSSREHVPSPFKLEERKRLAALAGIGEPYLYQCLTGRRDMNPAKALEIERITGGVLNRQQLCRTTWEGIWPELHVSPPDEQEARTLTPS